MFWMHECICSKNYLQANAASNKAWIFSGVYLVKERNKPNPNVYWILADMLKTVPINLVQYAALGVDHEIWRSGHRLRAGQLHVGILTNEPVPICVQSDHNLYSGQRNFATFPHNFPLNRRFGQQTSINRMSLMIFAVKFPNIRTHHHTKFNSQISLVS